MIARYVKKRRKICESNFIRLINTSFKFAQNIMPHKKINIHIYTIYIYTIYIYNIHLYNTNNIEESTIYTGLWGQEPKGG